MKGLLLALLLAASIPASAEEAAAPELPPAGVVSFAMPPVADSSRLATSLMRLANRLEEAAGVRSVEVRLSKRDVLVHYDPEKTGVPSLVTAVETMGYRATSTRTGELASAR